MMPVIYKEVPEALLEVDSQSPRQETPDDVETTRRPATLHLARVAVAILGLMVFTGVAVNYGHSQHTEVDPEVNALLQSGISMKSGKGNIADEPHDSEAAKLSPLKGEGGKGHKYVIKPMPTSPAPVATKHIDFYFEIGCPVCQVLLSGVMKTVASTYADSVNVDFRPWGNSFYGMASCSSDDAPKPESTVNPDPRYTPTARYCWSGKCGAEAPTKDPDCFTGPMICQHGPKACDLQGYALCGKKALGDDWKKVLEFMSCLEEGHKKAGQYKFPTGSIGFIVKDCCKKGGLDLATIDTCVKGDELTQLTMAEAGSTPKHRLVPYVVVDGEVLHGIGATPNMLITAIESTTPAVGPAAARRLTVI